MIAALLDLDGSADASLGADLPCGRAALREFINNAVYPCVGAKAAIGQGSLTIFEAADISSPQNDKAIHRALINSALENPADLGKFRSFAIVFSGPVLISETEFETFMWDRLQALANRDARLGFTHDDQVDSDPASPHFSLSFGGKGYFAIGLHPNSSRPARRFRFPAIVLNSHAQFERLRGRGQYEKMRSQILSRDLRFAGSINPMLARHGEQSAARQYSGRAVDSSWRCPFRDPRS